MIKIWKTPYADQKFSQAIIRRDGKCLKCFSKKDLTCSHYWRRGHSATRFDFDNCITLCRWCHSEWENLKNNVYREFMIKRLGKEKYEVLEIKARGFMKRSEATLELQAKLAELDG